MVNYCCVTGCGRSSKLSNHLNFYTLPKEKPRRIQWLKAAKRDDLLKNPNLKGTYRFCSRHFAPACIRNRILTSNAVPTLCLPNDEPGTDSKSVSTPHHDILCDSCKKTIMGFRYKCVTCDDYDLCPKCEMLETHPGHYMLRIPKPMKFKIADNLIKKWRAFFKAEHVNPDCSDDQSGHSSDDEPISKHLRNYDSGVDLAEDVKDTIRNEVARVLALKPEARKKRKKLMDKSSKISVKRAKSDRKVLEVEVEQPKPSVPEKVPEVAFADVNDYKDQVDVKNEIVASVASGAEENTFDQPLMHVRLSDDLSELMIEMTNNGEKTVFKYN